MEKMERNGKEGNETWELRVLRIHHATVEAFSYTKHRTSNQTVVWVDSTFLHWSD